MFRLHLHSYGSFGPGHAIGPSVWPCFDLLYFHEGEATLWIEEEPEAIFQAGQGVLLFPRTRFHGETHSASVLASVQHFSFVPNFDTSSLPPPLADLAPAERGYRLLHDHPRSAVEQDIDRAMRLATQGDDPATILIRQHLLMIILVQLLIDPTGTDGRRLERTSFADLMEWAQAHLAEGISVSDLATRMELSESHFRSRFATEVGMPAGQFMRQLRLVEAKRCLRETHEPIKSIAVRLGYGDVVAFHRAFRRDEGLTPGQYRKRFTPTG